MSPVLLDHRNLKWIWLSVGLFAFMTFFAGYILGFEKSNNKWMSKLDPMEITLPDVLLSDLNSSEQQIPESQEPGANIDVDSADEADDDIVAAVNNSDMYTGVVTSAAAGVLAKEVVKPVTVISKQEVLVEDPSTEAGSDINLLEIEPSSEQIIAALTIVDDATEETARYSIQVGMYKSFDNAASKVEKLINSDLSAYINDYKNKQDETRYNVRFGYFSSFSSGQQALAIYENNFAGSGYVARIQR